LLLYLSQIRIKIQGRQNLLKPLGIKIKYVELLEKYLTWLKILLLHLVVFKYISRVYFLEFLKVSLGAFICVDLSLIELEHNR
jgi:hypothetical protein